jgi:secreted PhoX family phosphatase
MSRWIRAGSSRHLAPVVGALLVAAIAAGTAYAIAKSDPGADYQHSLASESKTLFGFGHPLESTVSTPSFDGPGDQAVELAAGLSAKVVSSSVGEDADMIALWPNDENPTYAIICNEINGTIAGSPATVQRVNLETGVVTDMVSGNNSCDPIHTTAWGTVVFGEEIGTGSPPSTTPAGNAGRLYEILDPLHVSGITINRPLGTTSDPTHVVARTALGQLAFEGIVLLPDGTTYYGDERRPSGGKSAGGIFKFVPSTPRATAAPITSLDQSPLASGQVFVLRIGSRTSNGTPFADWGQGSQTGEGKWVPVTTAGNTTSVDLDPAAKAVGMTGYYRPEDMDLDPIAWSAGTFRACWNNTGIDAFEQWGETLCLNETPADPATYPTGARPNVEPFVIGNPELRMVDNLDFQPGTGVLYLLMDATTSAENPAFANDQVWACLPDGADPDILTDGCVRVMNLKDGEAEFTGIQFLGDGQSFLIHLQHRTQGPEGGRALPNTTDEILVSGLSIPH